MNVIDMHRRPKFFVAVLLAMACWGLANVALSAEQDAA